MNGDTGKPRNFEEITLAITILTGLSFILFKISDYFNTNTISLSDNLQFLVKTFVSGLLIELVIISSFLILKGYLLFAALSEERILSIADGLFNSFIIYFVFLGLISTFLFFLMIISTPTLIESPYYIYFLILYEALTVLASLRVIGFKKDDLKKSLRAFKEVREKSHYINVIIAEIIIITILFISLIAPIYLLGGSYSIDVFPQSETNNNILTFTIKETGLTSGKNFINLYKLSDKNVFQDIDNITINYTQETLSRNKMMLGEKHEGTWFLNVNTSNLSHGNYMLHAEVSFTNLVSIGIFKKHADKLFYIPSNSVNYSFDSR